MSTVCGHGDVSGSELTHPQVTQESAPKVTLDLFAQAGGELSIEELDPGAFILRGFVSQDAPALLSAVERIAAVSPFRHMVTPGGFRMSVAMTNCGRLGWASTPRGYRYDPVDPTTERPWPAMPAVFAELAAKAAAHVGFEAFDPDSCLINRYAPGARLSLHQDRDEANKAAPIVSVSLGVPATFLWGGLKRSDRTRRFRLESGDVVVWGGPSRFIFHGIAPLAEGLNPLTGNHRINLTFRRVRA